MIENGSVDETQKLRRIQFYRFYIKRDWNVRKPMYTTSFAKPLVSNFSMCENEI